MKTDIEQDSKDSENQGQELINSILALFLLGAKETFGEDAVVVLNEGIPGVYENNPTVMEYESKGFELCDANFFGMGFRRYEALTFRRETK